MLNTEGRRGGGEWGHPLMLAGVSRAAGVLVVLDVAQVLRLLQMAASVNFGEGC